MNLLFDFATVSIFFALILLPQYPLSFSAATAESPTSHEITGKQRINFFSHILYFTAHFKSYVASQKFLAHLMYGSSSAPCFIAIKIRFLFV